MSRLTRIWNVCGAHNASDLFHGLQIRTETSVTAEDLLVDDGRDGQTVETVGKRLPEFDVVAAFACKSGL